MQLLHGWRIDKLTIKVFDNFLDKNSFKLIKNIMHSNEFPYYINNVLPDKEYNIDIKNNLQFTHSFIHNGTISSNFISVINPIIDKIGNDGFIRVKANINPKTDYIIEHGYHYDIDIKEKNVYSAVYYLNTNNGYTKFKNNEIVNSVENRIVFFNNQSHTGSTCTDERFRSVINFVYLEEKWATLIFLIKMDTS